MRDAPWVLTDRHGHSQSIEVSGPFVANNRALLHQLALAGQGIIQSAKAWAQPALEAGQLVHLLPQWAPPTVEVFALTTTRLLPARVRLFLDFLVDRMDPQGGKPPAASRRR